MHVFYKSQLNPNPLATNKSKKTKIKPFMSYRTELIIDSDHLVTNEDSDYFVVYIPNNKYHIRIFSKNHGNTELSQFKM